MRWIAHLAAVAAIMTPAAAWAQGGEARGLISCGTGRQIVFFAGADDVVVRATVDGRAVNLPPGESIRTGEMEAFCGPGAPADALAALRANAEMNAGARIRDDAPSTDPAARTMDAALGAPSPHPLRTPGLPTASATAPAADPDWTACGETNDPEGCRAALLDARSKDQRGVVQAVAKAWREDGARGLIRLAHESWLIYGLLAVAALFAIPRLLRRRA